MIALKLVVLKQYFLFLPITQREVSLHSLAEQEKRLLEVKSYYLRALSRQLPAFSLPS